MSGFGDFEPFAFNEAFAFEGFDVDGFNGFNGFDAFDTLDAFDGFLLLIHFPLHLHRHLHWHLHLPL